MAREVAQTLSLWPWRRGLATAGQQTSVPEDSMWQARNISAGLDGLLSKRPGLRQWGQTIKTPDDGWFEAFLKEGVPGWVDGNASAGKVTWEANQGVLRTSAVPGAANETAVLSRGSAAPSGANGSVRMVLQVSNLPAYDGSSTNANTFHFRIADSTTTGKEFAVWSGGLYYKQASGSQYVLVADSEDLGAGKWTVLEIRVTGAGSTLIYLDEVLVATVTSSVIESVTLARADSPVELLWEVDDTEQYATSISGLMYSEEVADPFSPVTISAIYGWRAIIGAGVLQRVLVCATGDYVYHDANLLGVWRPLQRQSHDRVEFTTFRRQLLWVESNGVDLSKVYLWTGDSSSEPEELDEAPNCRFATEHQTRVWAAGDRENPLRIYYSGDRQPNVWFAPGQNSISDRFDTQLDAGYLEVPSRDGDEITAVYGDYFGQVLVFTRQAAYRVTGSGNSSYAIQGITQDTGAENSQCVTPVGNDVWFLSRDGVHTLAASDKFGDLIKGYMSGPIQDRWGGDASAVEPINKSFIGNARVKFNSTLGLVYVAVPLTSDDVARRVFIFNTTSEEWYGPWDIDSQAMEFTEIVSPAAQVMMHGGDAGKVLYTDELGKSDDGEAVESVIESAFLTGRAMNPAWVGVQKTWKRMRIYLLPRGAWDLKVFTRVDSGFYEEENLLDPNQNQDMNVFDVHVLTDEFRLGKDPDGRLHSRDEMGYIEVRPEKRGYSFAFKLVQSGNGEDVVIQGIEVDFIPHSHERE